MIRQDSIAIPLVSIACITYNQEKYIAQAIEGFLIQRTTFDVEILIHDDASTDKTADIIKQYQKKDRRIRSIFQKENQHSQGIKPFVDILSPLAKGKYIAICEGDDYWTDPYKLQKQVDFLETHPDYGLVHTDHDIFSEEKQKFINRKFNAVELNDKPSFEDILIKNPISTLTVLARSNIIREAIKALPKNNTWKMGDYPLWLEISRRTMISYLPEKTAVYRVLRNSMSNLNDYQKKMDFFNSVHAVKTYFIEKYGCSESVRKRIHNGYMKDRLKIAFVFRKKTSAQEAKKELLKNKAFNFLDALFVFGSKNKMNQFIVKSYMKVSKQVN